MRKPININMYFEELCGNFDFAYPVLVRSCDRVCSRPAALLATAWWSIWIRFCTELLLSDSCIAAPAGARLGVGVVSVADDTGNAAVTL
jgi:hypothetical protein